MSEQTETPDRAVGMVRGGHDLSSITWDAVANWQCSLCHRVFEFPSDAIENPCDVRLDVRLYTAHCDFTDGSRSTYDGLTLSDLIAIVGTLDNLDIIECSIEPIPGAGVDRD